MSDFSFMKKGNQLDYIFATNWATYKWYEFYLHNHSFHLSSTYFTTESYFYRKQTINDLYYNSTRSF